jgi:hypothetical protein
MRWSFTQSRECAWRDGYEGQLRTGLNGEIAELRKELTAILRLFPRLAGPPQNGKRPSLSAAARDKISAAQKRRWAARKSQTKG